MAESLDELRTRMQNLSDAELLDVLDNALRMFTPDAVNFARAEVGRRGGRDVLHARVEAERQPLDATPEATAADAKTEAKTQGHASGPPLLTMAHGSRTLVEESILNEWSMVVDHGAGHVGSVVAGIHRRLAEARIPGGCSWHLQEVKSSGFFSKTRREFVIVELDQFRDYRHYIGVRDFGVHLDCCRFLTVEPGAFKRMAAQRITGSAEGLSAPKNILVHQDLRAWSSVVHQAVIDSVEDVMTTLGKDPRLVHRGSKGALELW